MSEIVAAFSSRLANDRLLASLFQLAVSVSNHDFQENLVKKIFPNIGGGGKGEKSDDKDESAGQTAGKKTAVKPSECESEPASVDFREYPCKQDRK